MTNAAQSEVPYTGTERAHGIGVGPTLRKAWWLGLGILATIGEQTTRVADALVQKGREVEPSVTNPVKRAAGGLSNMAQRRPRISQAAEALSNIAMPSAVTGASGPTKEQFDRLAEEVRTLREKLGERSEGRIQG